MVYADFTLRPSFLCNTIANVHIIVGVTTFINGNWFTTLQKTNVSAIEMGYTVAETTCSTGKLTLQANKNQDQW